MKHDFRLLCMTTLTAGLTMILPGSTLESVMTFFKITKSEAGTMGMAFFFGGLIGILLTSVLISKLGAARTLGFSLLITGTCLCLTPLIGHFDLLMLDFFVLGIVFGVLVTLPGAVVSPLIKEESAGVLNTVYGFFSLGVVIEPQVAGFLLEKGLPWWSPYPVPGILAAITGVTTLLSKKFPEPPKQSPISIAMVRGLFRENPVVMIVGIFGTLLYVSSEATVSFWMVKFLRDSFPTTETVYRANTIMTLFWLGITAGRMAYSRFSKSVNGWKFLVASAFVCGALMAVTPHISSRIVMECGFAIAGLFFSTIYPTVTGYTGRLSPQGAGVAFSLMAAGGQVGGMALPPLVGVLADRGMFAFAMSLGAIPLLLLAVGIFAFSKKL